MKRTLVEMLRCPLTREKLILEVFETESRVYQGQTVEEILTGMLVSPCGYLYPITEGVPRLQLESFFEHESFIRQHRPDYDAIKDKFMANYGGVITKVTRRNYKTKRSFGMEWSIFRYQSDTTWGWDKESRKARFLQELNTNAENLAGKRLLDVGCGNGVLTSGIAEFGMETIGIDVSNSVEKAYRFNENPNVHYIQGDLQLPCFACESFDIVYSTGVIHHTDNTELSFSCISPLVLQGGILYVWLYRPEKDMKHQSLNFVRKFTNKMPLWLQYWIFLVFLVPQGLLKMRLKGVKRNWREQLISYVDVLSCEFRHEHTPVETAVWYAKRNYHSMKVTIEEYLGFGMYGVRK